jgi:D-beta-D-heptose 7-phosphate kinase/D-beta-D-heptose 1-phosphate adenosyltransferase
VRRAKGGGRPVQALDQRLRTLAAFACVDAVFGFGEDTPDKVVRAIKPDVLVKGEDWKDKGVVGREFVEGYGGRVVLAPMLDGMSTSRLIERIADAHAARGRGRDGAAAEAPR